MMLLILLTTLGLAENYFTGKEIRQVNEALEFYFNGEWRPVCANNWNEKNTKVACRHLSGSIEGGFAEIGVQVVNDKYWFNFLECVGDEAKLSHCKSKNMNHSGEGNAKLGVFLTCGKNKNNGRKLLDYTSGYNDPAPAPKITITSSPTMATTLRPKFCNLKVGRLRQKSHTHTVHSEHGVSQQVTKEYLEVECGDNTGDWRPVCDMNWLGRNNMVVCKELNPNCASNCFHVPVELVTIHKEHHFYTGQIYCSGAERELQTCKNESILSGKTFDICHACRGIRVDCKCPKAECKKVGENCKKSFNINDTSYNKCTSGPLKGFGEKPVCEIEVGPKQPRVVRTCENCPTPHPTLTPTKAPTQCHPHIIPPPGSKDKIPCPLPFTYEGKTYNHCARIHSYKFGKVSVCRGPPTSGGYSGPPEEGKLVPCSPCADCRPVGKPCLDEWHYNQKTYHRCDRPKPSQYQIDVCRVAGKKIPGKRIAGKKIDMGAYYYGPPKYEPDTFEPPTYEQSKIYKCDACPTPAPTKPPTKTPTTSPTPPPCLDRTVDKDDECFNPNGGCIPDADHWEIDVHKVIHEPYYCDSKKHKVKVPCNPCLHCKPINPKTHKGYPCEDTFKVPNDETIYNKCDEVPPVHGKGRGVCAVKRPEKNFKENVNCRIDCPQRFIRTIPPTPLPTKTPTKPPTMQPTPSPTEEPTSPPTKVPTQLCDGLILATLPGQPKCPDDFDGYYRKLGQGEETNWMEETKKLKLIWDHSLGNDGLGEWVIRESPSKSLLLRGLSRNYLDGIITKSATIDGALFGENTCKVELVCKNPTDHPTPAPTPTKRPTTEPTKPPTRHPVTSAPTPPPTQTPTTSTPTQSPSKPPTPSPTDAPSTPPTKAPTKEPTKYPTKEPTAPPTKVPTKNPTQRPIPPHYSCGVIYIEKCCDAFRGDYIRSTKLKEEKKFNNSEKGTKIEWIPAKHEWAIITAAGKEVPLIGVHKQQLGLRTKKVVVETLTCPPGSKTPKAECDVHCKETVPPTPSPTSQPTGAPTEEPTPSPTKSPTKPPTKSPTKPPTPSPTKYPTKPPTPSPTTLPPTNEPTNRPTTEMPTLAPSKPPSLTPTRSPTLPPPETICHRVCMYGNPFGKPKTFYLLRKTNGKDEWYSEENKSKFYWSGKREHQEYVIESQNGKIVKIPGMRNKSIGLNKKPVRLERIFYNGEPHDLVISCCDTKTPTLTPSARPTKSPVTPSPTHKPTKPPCECKVDIVFVVDYLSCEMTWRMQIQTVIKIVRDYMEKTFRFALVIHDHRARVWSRFTSGCVNQQNINDSIKKLRELQKMTPPPLEGRSSHVDAGIAQAIDLFLEESTGRQKLLILVTGSKPGFKDCPCKRFGRTFKGLNIRKMIFAHERNKILETGSFACLLPGAKCKLTASITNSCTKVSIGSYSGGSSAVEETTIKNDYYFSYQGLDDCERWTKFASLLCCKHSCEDKCTPWSKWSPCCPVSGMTRRHRQCTNKKPETEVQERKCLRIPDLFNDACPIDCKTTNQFKSCEYGCSKPKSKGKYSPDLCGFIESTCSTHLCWSKWPSKTTYKTECPAKHSWFTGSYSAQHAVVTQESSGGNGSFTHHDVTGKHIMFGVGAVLLIAGIYYKRKQSSSAHLYQEIPDEDVETL